MYLVARKDGVELGKLNPVLLIKGHSIRNLLLMLTILCTYKLIMTVMIKKIKKPLLLHMSVCVDSTFSLLKYLQGHFLFSIFSGTPLKK